MCWLGWVFGIQFFVHEKFIFSSHLSFSVFLCSFWYHGPLTKSNSVDPFLQIVNFQTLKIQLAVTFKVLIITCKICTWTSVQKFITRTMTFTMIRKNLQKKTLFCWSESTEPEDYLSTVHTPCESMDSFKAKHCIYNRRMLTTYFRTNTNTVPWNKIWSF